MEGKKRRFPWRAARWERMLLTAVATVLSGEVFFNLGNDNFRISGAVVLFPVLLLTLLQDSRTPLTGVLTGACLLLVRSAIDIVGGARFGPRPFCSTARRQFSTPATRACCACWCGTGTRPPVPAVVDLLAVRRGVQHCELLPGQWGAAQRRRLGLADGDWPGPALLAPWCCGE